MYDTWEEYRILHGVVDVGLGRHRGREGRLQCICCVMMSVRVLLMCCGIRKSSMEEFSHLRTTI